MANYNFNVVIKDQEGNLIESANVKIYDSSNDLVVSADTNASGVLASNVSLDTDDNPFRLYVTKTGSTTVDRPYNISYNDTSYYIELNNYVTTYATPLQTARFVYGDKYSFLGSTNITDSTVASFINMNEQEIDDFLKISFRENLVENETHDLIARSIDSYGFLPIMFNQRPILTKDSDWKIEVWNGSAYVDYVTSKTEGRDKDYYFDYHKSILYIKAINYGTQLLRLTYKWGKSSVPESIKKLCILKTALNLIDNEDYIGNIKQGDVYLPNKRDSYIKQIKQLEDNLRKVRF